VTDPAGALLARARRLQREAPLVDGHNDLAWELRERAAGELGRMDPGGPLPELHTDLPRLKAGGVGAQFWAAFVPFTEPSPLRATLEQIDLIRRMTERAPELEVAWTAEEVERIHGQGRIASLVGVEGGHAIENSLGVLRQFRRLGVRYLTLTHGSTIDWADASTDEARHGGLSPFGEEVVREMNRLGMLVDLSHVSADAARTALRVTEAPVVFSHSSAQAVADHPRNVPDDVLETVRSNRGVVMVTFYSAFVHPQGAELMRDMFEVQRRFQAQHPDDPHAAHEAYEAWRTASQIPRGSVALLADHVDHIARVAGIDHVGIGSDFDGVTLLPEGMEDVSCYPNLTAELLARGYTDDEVKKVLGENVLRVMREVDRVAERLQRERGPSTATIRELDG